MRCTPKQTKAYIAEQTAELAKLAAGARLANWPDCWNWRRSRPARDRPSNNARHGRPEPLDLNAFFAAEDGRGSRFNFFRFFYKIILGLY
jgi:hypothetical protein